MSSGSHDPALNKSCLILHAGALGDCVLTLHVAMALRRTGRRMSLAARSPIAAWAARRGMIDESISLDRFGSLLWGTLPPSADRDTDLLPFVKSFDQIISFLGGPDEAVAKRLTELCGPDRLIHIDPRPNEQTLREGRHITRQWSEEFITQSADFKSEISNLRLEIRIPDRLPGLVTSPSHHIATSPSLIVHPGSGGRAKCCPLEHLETLMSGLLSQGREAQWMIGPDEMERDGQKLVQQLERTAPVIFEESIDAAADIVSAADAFIGNDAGMTHVAALAGVNTVALFGPTDSRVWRPLGPRCRILPFPSPGENTEFWSASLASALLNKS